MAVTIQLAVVLGGLVLVVLPPVVRKIVCCTSGFVPRVPDFRGLTCINVRLKNGQFPSILTGCTLGCFKPMVHI
jgi:hypothetical protein